MDVQPVAPAPAAAAPPPAPPAPSTPTTGSDVLKAMSADQRASYEKTGDLPADIKPIFDDPDAASSAVPPVAPAAKTVASTEPASEPAKPGKGAEARKVELQKEIDGLLEQRAKLRKEMQAPPIQTPPAASSPAPVELGPKPDGLNYDKYPLGTSDPQYIEDLAGWKATSLYAERQKADSARTEKDRAAADARRIATEWGQKVDAVTAKHPDALEKFKTSIAIPQGSAADLWILESEMGPDTLYHLYDHPEEVTRITALSPLRQIEAMVLLGQSLRDAVPPVKTKTDAPPPAPRLDARPSPANDDADAALARGDFVTYDRIVTARETAGLRKGK